MNEHANGRTAPPKLFGRASLAINEWLARAEPFWVSDKLCWGIVAAGGALRLIAYLGNRSLWRDEAALAMNIIERSYSGLLKPLESYQTAPLGFLMLEKTAVLALGSSEYALRLIPLLAGIISLLLFKQVAAQCLRPAVVPIALAFFAFSDKLIYYSSELKQYSLDVAIALLIVLMAFRIHSQEISIARAAGFGLIGAAAVWFSHPAVFVLAGAGVCLFLYAAIKRDWKRALLLGCAGALWLLSFKANYAFALRSAGESGFLLRFWSDYDAFMPLQFSTAALKWLWQSFFVTLQDPAGFAFPVIAGLALAIGCCAALVNRNAKLLLLIAPIPFALLASGLHKYPFLERLLLWVVPLIVVLIAAGINAVARKSVVIGAALAVVLLVQPMVRSIAAPPPHEDIKPALAYVRDHWQEGDAIFVQRITRHPFHYYAARYGFEEFDLLSGGHKRRSKVEQVAENFSARERVWALLNVFNKREIEEEQLSLGHLDGIGTRLDAYREKGVAVYLYELSKTASLPDTHQE
ncbi:MAG: hypothetical protein AABO41_08490 [Acidobacteriota bacterium]